MALEDGTGEGDKTPIDTDKEKPETRVAYYADVDDNGTVDGIIFADLAVGSSGQWNDGNGAFSYEAKVQGTPPGYYIKEEEHTEEHWGTNPVIAPIKKDYDRTENYRFYVMELEDRKGQKKNGEDTPDFCWYDAAYDACISEYNTVTSDDFGTGRSNTANMLNKWRQGEGAYGARNDNTTLKDVWSLWGEDSEALSKTDVQEEDLEWFLPSRAEWSCFGKTFDITRVNYDTMYGLSDRYWTSTLNYTHSAWYAYLDNGYMLGRDLKFWSSVRFCTTF